MRRTLAVVAAAMTIVGAGVLTETQKPAGAKPTIYDVTVTVEGAPHTGTMALAVAGGKVSGSMHIKSPDEITGKAAGTVKGGEMLLDFPYHMVVRKCDGNFQAAVKMPDKKAPAKMTATVSILPCGRPDGSRLPGTIELTPVTKK